MNIKKLKKQKGGLNSIKFKNTQTDSISTNTENYSGEICTNKSQFIHKKKK